jgi:GntR family transcriptional regulator / MocR family aminotransferase
MLANRNLSTSLRPQRFSAAPSAQKPIRRTKRVYAAQGDALLNCLQARASDVTIAGLAAVLRLLEGAPDLSIAKEMLSAPTPLPLWYASTGSAHPGLLLGIATSPLKRVAAFCDRLFGMIDRLM